MSLVDVRLSTGNHFSDKMARRGLEYNPNEDNRSRPEIAAVDAWPDRICASTWASLHALVKMDESFDAGYGSCGYGTPGSTPNWGVYETWWRWQRWCCNFD